MSDDDPKLKSQNRIVELGHVLRNPLVLFGLVLILGDGPLVVAYWCAKDATQQWILLVALILFVFFMALVFCYLVVFRTRRLFAPSEFPHTIFDRDIYNDPPSNATLQSIAQNLEEIQDLEDKYKVVSVSFATERGVMPSEEVAKEYYKQNPSQIFQLFRLIAELNTKSTSSEED